MSRVTIHKLNGHGQSVVSYTGEVVERFPGGVRVEAEWVRPPLELGYTRFEPGDRFTEWYFSDRWYNIFEIRSGGTGALKGWYCNMATPAAVVGDIVSYQDLVLDLWVGPEGATRVLDEDELDADASLDEQTRVRARLALEEVQELVHARKAPFDAIVPL